MLLFVLGSNSLCRSLACHTVTLVSSPKGTKYSFKYLGSPNFSALQVSRQILYIILAFIESQCRSINAGIVLSHSRIFLISLAAYSVCFKVFSIVY